MSKYSVLGKAMPRLGFENVLSKEPAQRSVRVHVGSELSEPFDDRRISHRSQTKRPGNFGRITDWSVFNDKYLRRYSFKRAEIVVGALEVEIDK